MSEITADDIIYGQGVILVFKFDAVSDADTFEGPASPKAFWAQATFNTANQAKAGINVTESSGTYTFYPGEDAGSATLFVLL